jgi:hypothetical protein
VVGKVARDHCPQPSALFGDGVVHANAQLRLDFLERGPHAVASGFALELEGSAPRLAADVDEPQERERLRLAQPALRSSVRREAAELQQPGLVLVKLERKLLEPLAHRIPEAPRVGFVLDTHDEVVCSSMRINHFWSILSK